MASSRQSVQAACSTLAPRPAERVRRYLLDEFARRGPNQGNRLPSVRQVAKQVEVSTATVQSVFQKLAEEGRIRSEVGSGSFWTDIEEKQANQVLRFGINIPVPQGALPSDWTYQIYGGILHGVLQSQQPIVLRSLPWEALEKEDAGVDFLEESRRLDGLILFPCRFSRRLRRICEEEGHPVVDLNPPGETATTNFVAPDYYGASRIIATALQRAGRRRIAVLVSPPLEESVSVRLRCAGVAAGLGDRLGRGVEMRIFTVADRDEETGRRAVEDMLAEGFFPDGLYCAGDSLALGALAALQAKGIRVPEEVSVLGGNGLGLQSSSSQTLTGMRHSLDVLGAELVGMLLRRVTGAACDLPGIHLPPIFNIGSSTLTTENEILQKLTTQSTP